MIKRFLVSPLALFDAPHDANIGTKPRIWPTAAWAAIWFLVLVSLRYKTGMGEPDAVYMAAGVYQGILKGTYLTDSMLYYPQGHFLYYALLYLLLKPLTLTIHNVIAVMNWLSVISAAIAFGVLLHLLRRSLSTIPALASVLLVFASPTFLEWGTFGHPALLSLMFALLGTYALVIHSGDTQDQHRSWGGLLLALGLYVAAIGTRADVMIFFPGLGLLIAASDGKKLGLVWQSCCVMAAAIILYWLLAILVRNTWPFQSTTSFLEPITRIYNMGSKLHVWAEGFARLALASGLATCLLAIVGLGHSMKHRMWWGTAGASAFVVPGFLYGLGYLSSRHLMVAIAGIALFASVPLVHLVRNGRRSIAIGLSSAALMLNLWLPSIAGSIAGDTDREHTPWYFKSWTDRHYGNQQYWSWDESRWQRLLPTLDTSSILVGTWLDEAGLVAALCRKGKSVTRIPSSRGEEWTTYLTPQAKLDFLEAYSSTARQSPTGVAAHGVQVVLLSSYDTEVPDVGSATREAPPPDGVGFVGQ